MPDPAQPLKDLRPAHDFLVGIDSDGCAFDTMEIKHKECFTPNIIKHFKLQAVSKYAREAEEFVNLYSKWRGINRWPALVMVFDLLRERPEVQARGVAIPEAKAIRQWMEVETKLGNPALKAAVEAGGDPELALGLAWSEGVNATVADMVEGVPPFPYVRESLQKLQPVADAIVVSATPCEALQREWEEHDIAKYVRVIAGQEMGTKKEHLAFAGKDKYAPEKTLMIGDAPGDRKAGKANGTLFFPIVPGREEQSWKRFHDEALERFLSGTFAGAYETALIEEFEASLPDTPPWRKPRSAEVVATRLKFMLRDGVDPNENRRMLYLLRLSMGIEALQFAVRWLEGLKTQETTEYADWTMAAVVTAGWAGEAIRWVKKGITKEYIRPDALAAYGDDLIEFFDEARSDKAGRVISRLHYVRDKCFGHWDKQVAQRCFDKTGKAGKRSPMVELCEPGRVREFRCPLAIEAFNLALIDGLEYDKPDREFVRELSEAVGKTLRMLVAFAEALIQDLEPSCLRAE